jgi:hypothetical protein
MNTDAGPLLRDIHLPPEPGWWPPAPGWWMLAGIALILLVWVASRWRRRRRLAAARRGLQHEWQRVIDADPGDAGAAARVAGMSLLLRRAARRYARNQSTLRDEDWLAFLDGDDPRRPFREGVGRLLLDGPYRAQVPADEAAALAELVRARLDRFVSVTHV